MLKSLCDNRVRINVNDWMSCIVIDYSNKKLYDSQHLAVFGNVCITRLERSVDYYYIYRYQKVESIDMLRK